MVLKRLIHHQKIVIIYALIVLSFGLLGIGLEIERALDSDHFVASLFVTFLYFTTQSNLLLTITLLLFLLKKHDKKIVNYLAFITLVNILITAIVFHTLLVPYMTNINFMHHVLHTINPILYVIFYFIFFDYKIPINKFWISLIYPLIFMFLVYVLIEPFFGDLIEITAPSRCSTTMPHIASQRQQVRWCSPPRVISWPLCVGAGSGRAVPQQAETGQ